MKQWYILALTDHGLRMPADVCASRLSRLLCTEVLVPADTMPGYALAADPSNAARLRAVTRPMATVVASPTGEPRTITDAERLSARAKSRRGKNRRFRRGTPVVITSGPYRDIAGTVASDDGITVAVDLPLRSCRSTRVPRAAVARSEEP